MVIASVERRLVAILAADVVGYSSLVEKDEAGTLSSLKALRRDVIDPLLAQHHGRLVKQTGDGELAEFASVVDAVNCALAVQKNVVEHQASKAPEQRLVFRIGVNLGDVVVEGEDLLGDGVNIAARLEQICDPGGVMISGTAFDHLQGKLDLPMEFAGEQHVKNIARTIRAYRARVDGVPPLRRMSRLWRPVRRIAVVVGAGALVLLAGLAGFWAIGPHKATEPIGEPTLAVLPFQNMSGSPDADHLGQGVAEDVITVLSTYPGIRVVSRTSSFAFDKPAPVQDIGKALGARYVVEGSVRKEGNQIRVTAQLINAASGEHIWASNYDETGQDILALQAEVANRIYDSVAGITGKIRDAEVQQAWSRSPLDLGEYDYYLRGHQIFMRDEPGDGLTARKIWEEGLRKFPRSALLLVKIGFAYNRDLIRGQSADPKADLAKLDQLASEARIIPDKPKIAIWLGHWLDAYVAYWHEDWPRALSEAEATVRQVPNDPTSRGDLAYVLASGGRLSEAVEWAAEALRRDPHGPRWYRWNLGYALYLDSRAAEAIAALEPITASEPTIRAAAYVRLGQLDEAKLSLQRYMKSDPSWTLAKEASYPMIERLEGPYLDDLRKAGAPES